MGKNDEAISRPPRVLVTGGGSGIGLKTVQSLLADHGAHVAVLTLDVSLELERLKATYTSERLLIIPGDVTAVGPNPPPSTCTQRRTKNVGFHAVILMLISICT